MRAIIDKWKAMEPVPRYMLAVGAAAVLLVVLYGLGKAIVGG